MSSVSVIGAQDAQVGTGALGLDEGEFYTASEQKPKTALSSSFTSSLSSSASYGTLPSLSKEKEGTKEKESNEEKTTKKRRNMAKRSSMMSLTKLSKVGYCGGKTRLLLFFLFLSHIYHAAQKGIEGRQYRNEGGKPIKQDLEFSVNVWTFATEQFQL